MFFIKFRNFSAVISLNIFLLFSFSPFLVLLTLCIIRCSYWCPIFLWGAVYFSSFLSLFFGLLDLYQSTSLLIPSSPIQIYYWAALVNFLFWLLLFSTPEFPFGFLISFSLFIFPIFLTSLLEYNCFTMVC